MSRKQWGRINTVYTNTVFVFIFTVNKRAFVCRWRVTRHLQERFYRILAINLSSVVVTLKMAGAVVTPHPETPFHTCSISSNRCVKVWMTCWLCLFTYVYILWKLFLFPNMPRLSDTSCWYTVYPSLGLLCAWLYCRASLLCVSFFCLWVSYPDVFCILSLMSLTATETL